MTDHHHPWTALPGRLADVLMPLLPGVTEEVIALVRRDVPVYAGPLDTGYGEVIRRGTEAALQGFLKLPGTDRDALSPEDRRIYESLGRGELRQGRSMESLLAAYRLGARTILRSLSEAALAAGFDPRVLIALGESVLAYIEELSAASAEGFAAEQSERAGDRDRLRNTVADLLVRGTARPEAVRDAAASAGWPLPPRVVVATLDLARRDGLRPLLGDRSLLIVRPADAVVISPAPATAAAREVLAQRLTGRGASIGPARPWAAAAESLRLATTARAALGPAAPPVDGPPLWVDEHLATLLLAAEPGLVQDLAARRLAPLEGLRPGQRTRLRATLLAWLRHQGQRGAVAAELGIHEQTVGYRVNQLRDAFGETLADPEARFELELALRAQA